MRMLPLLVILLASTVSGLVIDGIEVKSWAEGHAINPKNFAVINGRNYYFSTVLSEHPEDAFTVCVDVGMTLISLETAEEDLAISSYIFQEIGEKVSFLTSGVKSDYIWMWSGTGQPFTHENWATGEPKNTGSTQTIVYISDKLGWAVTFNNGSVSMRYICEQNVPCSGLTHENNQGLTHYGTKVFSWAQGHDLDPKSFALIDGRQYYFYPHTTSGDDEAILFCNSIGMTCLSLETESENLVVRNYIGDVLGSSTSYSTSGFAYGPTKWIWRGSGRMANYTDWRSGTPPPTIEDHDQYRIEFNKNDASWFSNLAFFSGNLICEQLENC